MDDGSLQYYPPDRETMSFSEIGKGCVIWPALFVAPFHPSVSIAMGKSANCGNCVSKSFESPSLRIWKPVQALNAI